MNIPNTLKTKIREGRLIPVVCAGVSMAIKNKEGQSVFPSWPTLLERAAKVALDENKEKLSTAISALIALNKLQQAAEFAKEALIGDNWNDFLEKQFDVDLEQLDSSSSSLQKALWKLSHRHITLNYDHCLEWANDNSANLNYFDNSSTRQLKKFKANDISKDMVWHLHGTIKEPEHLVLTPESYNRLYGKGGKGEYAAALSALNEIMSSDNLLFVGSSMSDVELLAELGGQNKLFSGNTGPHYVLVREKQKEETIRTLGELTNVIEVLTFSNFGDPLVEAVEELASHVPQKKKITDTLDNRDSVNQPNEAIISFDTISIHLANPIDKPRDYDYLTKFTKGFKGNVEKHYLSCDSLWNESDYTFIFTRLTKNGFLIEDESCCSDFISVEEFLYELPTDTKGVFIFVDDIPSNITEDIIEEYTNIPVAIYQIDHKNKKQKRIIDNTYQQVFKKNNILLSDVFLISNEDSFNLEANFSGSNCIETSVVTALNNVDKKSLTNFIGRTSDLSSISREVTRIENKSLGLVLKGSGGIGKTTIASKLALEYSKRGKFKHGITFIDCEPISSYEQFYQKISEAFSLHWITDLEQHLIDNRYDNERLIILDNYESILNLEVDKNKFLDLSGIITEYCSLIITSRDRCQEPWEQELSLRSLEPDEGLEIFNTYTKNLYKSKKEQKHLKEEIIEKLLDCNPLAIELVSSNTPPGKDIYELEKDLIKEFDTIEDSTYYLTSKSDSNITRKKSLLGSINYSYNTLNDVDKRALELISLFPDGVSLRNLREIARNNKSQSENSLKISDKTIKTLSDKSLLINSGKDIKLHSIISRFTLSKARNNESNKLYWKKVAHYNLRFINEIEKVHINHEFVACHLIVSYINNFLLTIENIEQLDLNKENIAIWLIYIHDIMDFASLVSIFKPIENAIVKCKKSLKSLNLEHEDETLFKLILITIDYNQGKYTKSLKKLLEVSPMESLNPHCKVYSTQYYINRLSIDKYVKEGYIEEGFKHTLDGEIYGGYYPYTLLMAGVLSDEILDTCDLNSSYFEAKRINGTLDIGELNTYLSSIHPQEHSEHCMVNFILNTVSPITESEVSRLVSTTPLGSGIKLAMMAKIKSDKINIEYDDTCNINEIHELYEASLSKVTYDKYIYLFVLNEYCKFLLSNDFIDKFQEIHATMVKVNSSCSFPYWSHEIKRLIDPSVSPFEPSENLNPYGINTEEYIKKFVKNTAMIRKKYKFSNK